MNQAAALKKCFTILDRLFIFIIGQATRPSYPSYLSYLSYLSSLSRREEDWTDWTDCWTILAKHYYASFPSFGKQQCAAFPSPRGCLC